MNLLRVFWAFLRRDAKMALSYRFQFFVQVAGVFSVCITFFFLSLMMKRVEGSIGALAKYGGSYFGFAIVGAAMSTYLDTSLRTFGLAIRTAQITGTLEAMLTTRARIAPIIAGSGVYTLVFTTLRTALYFVFAGTLFQLPLHLGTWPAVLLIVVLTVSSTLALGIFAAGFIVWFKQGDPVTAMVSGLSWLLSGILYPKEILPAGVQRVADLLPMTHTLESLRLALLVGVPFDALARSILYLVAFTALGIPASVVWFKFAVSRAKVAGSLARY